MGHPDGTDVIDLINPANEEITGSIISASKKDVDDAVKSAKKSFEIASALTLEQKKKKCCKKLLMKGDGYKKKRLCKSHL